MTITWHRFVPHRRVADYLELGWCPCPTLVETHHGLWSVHLAWVCDCKMVEPK